MGNIQFYNNKILFVNNKIAMHPDCCCSGVPIGDDCETACSDDRAPQYLVVTFSILTDGSCECSNFNGVGFTLEQATASLGPCDWLYGPEPPTGECRMSIHAWVGHYGGVWTASVELFQSTTGNAWSALFSRQQSEALDCLDLGTLSFVSQSNQGDTPPCDASGASCTVVGGYAP